LIGAYSIVADPQPFASRGQVAAFQALLDHAERIRSSLGALAAGRAQLLAAGPDPTAKLLESVASATSGILRMIAAALADARSPADPYGTWRRIHALTAELESRLSHPSGLYCVIAVSNVRALLGQLRAAWRLARIPEGERESAEIGEARLSQPRLLEPLSDAARTLWANFTLQAQSWQYAARLAIALMVAALLSHALALGHAYWLPITLAIILKPDFDATLERGIARISGTIVGAGVTTVIVAALHPGPAALSALVLAFAWCCYTIYLANYAAYAVCLTGYVVFLVAFEGAPPISIALARSMETVLGGVLALLAYAAWPVSKPENIRVMLAELLKAQCQRGTAVLLAYAHPGQYAAAPLPELTLAARLARSNAEASVDAMMSAVIQQPSIERQLAVGVLAAVRLYALGSMTLQAHLETVTDAPLPALDPLISQLESSLTALAVSLRSHKPLPRLPPLRDTHGRMLRGFSALGAANRALQGRGNRTMPLSPDDQELAFKAELVSSETDLMVDSVNTIDLLLSKQDKSRPMAKTRATGSAGK
ncbi:MAG: FUSC family protein, partial [Terriglobia bacterium]